MKLNKLNKKIIPIILTGFLLIPLFSALVSVNTVNSETCADECAYIGQTQTLGDSYRTCGDYDSDCCYEWSQWYTNEPTCSDECAYTGQHQCSGTSGKTCGNYDSDCCYEWSSWSSCDSQCYSCGDGTCNSTCGETSSNCSSDCGPTCADECAYIGQHQCSGTSGKTCGNYDSDCCYEWSSWSSCDSQCYSCGDGTCNLACGETSSNCPSDCGCLSPSVDIKANGSNGPITVSYKNNITLSWSSENSATCQASGDWSGTKAVSGSQVIQMNEVKTNTFTITCEESTGTKTDIDSVTVVVTPNPPVVITKPAIVTY